MGFVFSFELCGLGLDEPMEDGFEFRERDYPTPHFTEPGINYMMITNYKLQK
jgi:hypothetical protein